MIIDFLYNETADDDGGPATVSRRRENGQPLTRPGDRLVYAATIAVLPGQGDTVIDLANAAVAAAADLGSAELLPGDPLRPERLFRAGDVLRIHTGPGRITTLTATRTGWERLDLSQYTVVDHRDQEHAHLDTALAKIRQAYPSAVTVEFAAQTSHHGQFGYVLHDVALADGSRISATDSPMLARLDAATWQDLDTLEWDGVLREKRTGFASFTPSASALTTHPRPAVPAPAALPSHANTT